MTGTRWCLRARRSTCRARRSTCRSDWRRRACTRGAQPRGRARPSAVLASQGCAAAVACGRAGPAGTRRFCRYWKDACSSARNRVPVEPRRRKQQSPNTEKALRPAGGRQARVVMNAWRFVLSLLAVPGRMSRPHSSRLPVRQFRGGSPRVCAVSIRTSGRIAGELCYNIVLSFVLSLLAVLPSPLLLFIK